jgi:hypothetical protein
MMTELMLRERLGELLPEGVALGPDGEPTRDAARARRGALLPFGGYKGFGLALMMQALGLLAGFGPNGERDYGYLFIAFKPDLLGPADVFEREVTHLLERVKATPRQSGVNEIRNSVRAGISLSRARPPRGIGGRSARIRCAGGLGARCRRRIRRWPPRISEFLDEPLTGASSVIVAALVDRMLNSTGIFVHGTQPGVG